MIKKLFNFDDFFLPRLTIALYRVGIFLVVLGAILTCFDPEFSLSSVLSGLLVLIFGLVGLRLWAEIFLVLFEINDSLKDIRETLKKGDHHAP